MSGGVPEPIAVAPLDVGVDADLVDHDPHVHLDLGHGVLLPPGFHYPVEGVDVGVAHGGVEGWARDTYSWLLKSCGRGRSLGEAWALL